MVRIFLYILFCLSLIVKEATAEEIRDFVGCYFRISQTEYGPSIEELAIALVDQGTIEVFLSNNGHHVCMGHFWAVQQKTKGAKIWVSNKVDDTYCDDPNCTFTLVFKDSEVLVEGTKECRQFCGQAASLNSRFRVNEKKIDITSCRGFATIKKVTR